MQLRIRTLAVLALAAASASPVLAEEIVVSNYGVSANGMPFAVAMDKGYFKDEGINVTGIITSAGGGTTLRNMLAGNAQYGEVNPVVVVSAVLQGADLRIISDNVSACDGVFFAELEGMVEQFRARNDEASARKLKEVGDFMARLRFMI